MSDAKLGPIRTSAPRARVVRRAKATSDQTRVVDMLVAACVAALAASVALLVVNGDPRSKGALALPHAAAHLECASCHGNVGDRARAPENACVGCHASSTHASTRSAHRALVAGNRITCTTCHPAHDDPQGITFRGDGTFARWIGDRARVGTLEPNVPLRGTVALVAASACTKCHDSSNLRDPAARCVSGSGAAVVTCFDEHRRDPGARFVAWDAARKIAASPAALPPLRPHTPFLPIGLAIALSSTALFVIGAYRARRRVRPTIPASALAPVARKRLPRIDPSTCLGCYACVDACPFDVLEIRRYVAVVAKPAECCGVILCAQACPNESLRIDDEGPRAGAPRIDANLESLDAPGVFLAGDLTGLPLIKNAIHQGVRVVDRIAASKIVRRRGEPACDADLIVVGAGPAGLSAMLRAKERGLRAIALEQGALAASIRQFPRNKLVFDPPIDLPLEGSLWLREATKEELVAQWSRIVRAHALDVREAHRVTAIAGTSSDITVTAMAARGEVTLRAPRLLLAIGKRGTPRTLAPEVTALAGDKISYALADARTFAGAHVLVVGLGDTAMEASIALARQPDTVVTISYRGADFARGKGRNVAELRALVARGKVRIVWNSEVVSADARTVTLRVASSDERLPNDAIFPLLGGIVSWDLLHAAGVKPEKNGILEGIVPIENLLRARPSEAR